MRSSWSSGSTARVSIPAYPCSSKVRRSTSSTCCSTTRPAGSHSGKPDSGVGRAIGEILSRRWCRVGRQGSGGRRYVPQVRVAAQLGADRAARPVARHHHRVGHVLGEPGQAQGHRPGVAARQVRPAHGAGEQHVPGQQGRRAGVLDQVGGRALGVPGRCNASSAGRGPGRAARSPAAASRGSPRSAGRADRAAPPSRAAGRRAVRASRTGPRAGRRRPRAGAAARPRAGRADLRPRCGPRARAWGARRPASSPPARPGRAAAPPRRRPGPPPRRPRSSTRTAQVAPSRGASRVRSSTVAA